MIYVLLANGFEEIEALTPIDILRRTGAEVLTAGVTGKTVTGAHDITVTADILLSEVKKEQMSCLIIPGGMGYTNIEESAEAISLIQYAKDRNILICAICAAPSILGKMGFLSGKRATCFPGFEGFLEGAILCSEKVVCDGNFITAKGAGAASEFGFLIAEKMVSVEKSAEIKKSMQY